MFHLTAIKLTLLNHMSNAKFLAGFGLLVVSPVQEFIQKYLFSDIGFLKWLIIAMIIDLVTGIAKAWVKKEPITSKGLRDTVGKCIQYGGFLIITHVLTSFEINGQQPINFSWLPKLAFEFIILIEIKSVYENIVAINPKLDLWQKVIKKIAEVLKTDDKKS